MRKLLAPWPCRLGLTVALALSAQDALAERGAGSLFDAERAVHWRGTGGGALPVRRAAPGALLDLDRPGGWVRVSVRAPVTARPGPASARARLRTLIASAEAGADGYDAVQHGARHRPHRPPTRMRLGEILDWIAATPGQPHAIGRYQFIPTTLRALMRRGGVPRSALFTPALQDRLADMLLEDAGISEFEAGRLAPARFMDNLARIWAGLPTRRDRSHYHGVAGNRATISRDSFARQIAAIYP